MGYGNCGGERTLAANGNEDHCCYLQDEVCPLLVDWGGTVACSLMLMADGEWAEVHLDPRYLAWVKPRLDQMGTSSFDCGDHPGVGATCGNCGVTGTGAVGGTPVALRPNEKNALQRDVIVPQLEAWAEAHPDEGG